MKLDSLYRLLRNVPVPRQIRRIGKALLLSVKHGGAAEGCVERFYFKYDRDKVLESEWVAHYFIYRKFLQIAERVPTLDLCSGSGAGTKLIAESLRVRVVGVDYSVEALKFAENQNQNSLIEYYQLDLNKTNSLDFLRELIVSKGLQQVFFIEGIEHIQSPNEVISTILESGIERVFISTPFEQESTTRLGYHVYPFTPSVYDRFVVRFGSKVLS